MKEKQIQSYLTETDHNRLKTVADKRGLSVASLIRELILNYLKNGK